MEAEIIKDANGNVVGEIREENGNFVIWKREQPSFPPKSRYSVVGSAPSLEQARRLAAKLLG